MDDVVVLNVTHKLLKALEMKARMSDSEELASDLTTDPAVTTA